MSKRDARRKLLARLKAERTNFFWIDARWLEALGRDAIDALLREHGWQPMKGASAA